MFHPLVSLKEEEEEKENIMPFLSLDTSFKPNRLHTIDIQLKGSFNLQYSCSYPSFYLSSSFFFLFFQVNTFAFNAAFETTPRRQIISVKWLRFFTSILGYFFLKMSSEILSISCIFYVFIR